MASIFRRTYGSTVKGRKVVKTCAHYTIEYTSPDGRRRRAKGYRDKGASIQLAARLERAVARGAEGLTDPYAEHRARPLTGHIADYIGHLRTAGRDDMYVYTADKRLAIIVKGCGWATLGDVEPNGFMRWREAEKGGKRRGPGRSDGGPSATTLNQYLATLRGFLNWCVKNERIDFNALVKVEVVRGEVMRRRRALSEVEIGKVLAAAPESRRFAWEVLLMTGLRVQEAIDLEWQDVRIDCTQPYLSLRASKVKSRRDQRASLRSDVAVKFREARPADFDPSGRVFPTFPCLESWKKDLAEAGIAYKDGADRQVDRHALRTTMATRLQRAGVPVRVAMELMRHSDIRLTTKVYTDPTAFDLSGAIESLPPLPAAATAAAQSAAG